MRISYNWLKDFLPELQQSPAEVAELLTMHSFETLVAEEFSLDPTIQVVKILKIEPHPNADRLRLATVTNGTEEFQVVCGAPNIVEGALVPHAPVGAKVLDKDGQFFELTKAKIRGVESPGMLNSKRELGLGADHDGIFLLPADTPIGSKLIEHIPADTMLECDITSNRAHDCLSHRGVAREVAALLNISFKDVEKKELPVAAESASGRTITVEDPHLTPRYLNVVMDGITNGPSPLWLQARLLLMNSRPINAVVDISNYVMFELGNPSHAFDTTLLNGAKIEVRSAKQGEDIVLLDGSKQELSADALVIADEKKPVAIAGIMGGEKTSVTESTKEIVLEVANFNGPAIQAVSKIMNIRTEAAARFMKGIDPNLVQEAAERLSALYESITGAKVSGVLDNYPNPLQAPKISFRIAEATKVAGMEISETSAEKALTNLRFSIEKEADTWLVTPPTDRLDIQEEHDVVEEVIRVIGLTNIPSNVRPQFTQGKPLSKELYWREKIRELLVEAGFTETYNYSFEPEKYANILALPKDGHLEVANPISPEQALLRTSLLPGLVQNMVKNKAEFNRKIVDVTPALFEIGHVYKKGDGGQVAGVVEEQYVSAITTHSMEFLKKTLEEVLAILRIENIKWVEIDPTIFPAISVLQLQINNSPVGMLGKIKLATARKAKLPIPPAIFEVNLDTLLASAAEPDQKNKTLDEIKETNSATETIQFRELAKYPSVYRDIAILVPVDVTNETVQEVIERVGGEKVARAVLFDEFEPEGGVKKSLAFHIEYQDQEKTLTDEEVDAIHSSIESALKQELEAEIR